MKQSLMSRLEQPNFAVSTRAACLRLGAQDGTARPWNTSTRSHSPPAGRFVHRSELPVPRPAEMSNNSWQESVSAWLLSYMFFDTQRSAGLVREMPSVCLSRLRIGAGLPIRVTLSQRYPWDSRPG